MTPSSLIPSQTLDLTPKKKTRRGKYDQEAIDALLAKAENLPEEMTPAMEEAVRRHEEMKNNPYKKNYDELLKTLSPEEQENMKKTIQLNPKGGIDIVPMNIKNMKPLTATPDNEEIFDGSYVDKNGDTGIKGVTYLTGKAAEREVEIQSKKLLKDRSEVEQFVSFFPGENTKEKILNFVKLFGLEKAGYWTPDNKRWSDVGSVGYVGMSKVDGNGSVYALGWLIGIAHIGRYDQKFPSPFLAFEDC